MHPVVNIDDPLGKVVGRRKPASRLVASPHETGAKRPWAAMDFFPSIKRGVYSFKSREEANQWRMDHSIRKPEN